MILDMILDFGLQYIMKMKEACQMKMEMGLENGSARESPVDMAEDMSLSLEIT